MSTNKSRGCLRGLLSLLVCAAFVGWSGAAYAGGLVCPGVCIGGTNHNERCFTVADCPGADTVCQIPDRCVYLEWRPAQVVVPQGAVANIELWAYSSDGFTIPVDAFDVILNWDETRLQLLGKVDPCLVCAGGTNSGNVCQTAADCPGSSCVAPGLCFEGCPAQTYNWFTSFFPNDCGGDALNEPCTGGVPANDGDAHYQNFRQLQCGADPAPAPMVTPLGDGTGGLHVTTFQFQPLISAGGALVDIPLEQGQTTQTRVLGGSVPGLSILGLIDDPVQIIVADICDPPTVAAAGCRYIDITPPAGTSTVALRVKGSTTDADVSCITKYVNMFCRGGASNGSACQTNTDCGTGTCTDARLGATAQYRTPAQWGTVSVTGVEIEPDTLYTVRTDCGVVQGDLLSNPVNVTTRKWGDTATPANGLANFQDINTTIEAFQGNPSIRIEATDISGPGACNPNHLVNFLDISANVDAFQLEPFHGAVCVAPCP